MNVPPTRTITSAMSRAFMSRIKRRGKEAEEAEETLSGPNTHGDEHACVLPKYVSVFVEGASGASDPILRAEILLSPYGLFLGGEVHSNNNVNTFGQT